MKVNNMTARRWMLVLLILAIFGIFIARMIIMQVIQPDHIIDMLPVGSTTMQTVKATRGEIVDRNGVPLVSNTLGYDVFIDMAMFPRAERNDIILRLIGLFEDNGAEWNDGLPVTRTEPFRFLEEENSAAEIARLKEHLGVQSYSSVEDTMYHLAKRYGLQDYTAEEMRKIGGVRYEMDFRGFNLNTPFIFATDVGIDMVLRVKERSYQLAGVDIQESALRHYEHGDIAPHIIGRMGPLYAEDLDLIEEKGYALDDIIGKSGIEYAMEDVLRGQSGERMISLDADNRVIGVEETTPPIPGNTVVLTIDAQLQELTQKALEAQIGVLQRTANPGEGKEADYGAAVVLKVKTGEVLAAATFPSYDQEDYATSYAALAADPGQPLYNRALMGLYAPGSTFKPMVATAALGSGTIPATDVVHCGMVYTRFTDYRPKCLSAHGNIGLRDALSWSCNIFFYDVGWRTGIENIDRYGEAYGLGEPTGIEVGEAVGQRSNPETYGRFNSEPWSDGAVLQTSIGQLVAQFSPVQMANYAATIANRGKRMKVTLINEIRDYSQTNVITPFEPEVVATVDASSENYDAIIHGMVTASRSGSAARHFSTYPFDVASKTGTPETNTDYQNSTFICFGPAQDPEIAIFVVIENGWHGYTAAPVARAIMDEYFGIYNPNPLVPRDSLSLGYSGDGERAAQAAGDTATGEQSQSAPQVPVAPAQPAEPEPEEPEEEPAEESEPEKQLLRPGDFRLPPEYR